MIDCKTRPSPQVYVVVGSRTYGWIDSWLGRMNYRHYYRYFFLARFAENKLATPGGRKKG